MRRNSEHSVAPVVPSFAGWGSFPRATANLLIAGLAIFAGTWVTHQLVYLAAYGDRFGAVMASTPHHRYMATIGLLFLLLAAAGAVALLSLLALGHTERARLTRLLPDRVARLVGAPTRPLPLAKVARLAAVLAACQISLYVLQENLEAASVTGAWPLLGVLLGRHVTAVPLHILVATCSSVLLWSAALWLRRSRDDLHLARALARAFAPRRGELAPLLPRALRVPSLKARPGSLGLRSPPLSA